MQESSISRGGRERNQLRSGGNLKHQFLQDSERKWDWVIEVNYKTDPAGDDAVVVKGEAAGS